MKFLCLSYWDEKKFDLMSESERETFVKECSAYDNVLRRNGHFLRLEALQVRGAQQPCATGTERCPSPMARTLRLKDN
jgi:hypothetical protein